MESLISPLHLDRPSIHESGDLQATLGKKVFSLMDAKLGNIFEWLFEYSWKDSIKITENHPVLEWHFWNGKAIVPGVILKSIALHLAEHNIKRVTSPKVTFLNICLPWDILSFDKNRKVLTAKRWENSVDIAMIEDVLFCIATPIYSHSEEPDFHEHTLDETTLDTHLPQKPPFRFLNGYKKLEVASELQPSFTSAWYIDDLNSVTRETIEEAAAQAISYHLSQENNPEWYEKWGILTYETSHVITYPTSIDDLRMGDALVTYGHIHSDYIEYQVVNHRRNAIVAEWRITGKKLRWKTFSKLHSLLTKKAP